MNQQVKKKPAKSPSTDTLIEQLRDIGGGVAKSVTSDVVKGIGQDALSAFFGPKRHGNLEPGQPVKLGDKSPDKHANQDDLYQEDDPWFSQQKDEQKRTNYLAETVALMEQHEREVGQKIEEIRLELKALIATLRVMDKEVVKAVNEQFVDPGLYHITYLDRLKTILKLMRKNISDSNSWLSTMRSRKKEKRYWNQYKKKGTTFGLSNERNVSTQVG